MKKKKQKIINKQVTGSEEGSVIFWDVVKGKIINCFNIEDDQIMYNAKKRKAILSLNFSFDESYLVCNSRKRISYYYLNDLREEHY